MTASIARHAAAEYPALASDSHFLKALDAVGVVPRERFVPASQRAKAYSDVPLPIGYDQTISDPYVVSVMTAALRLPDHARVLEIGTGSGYQAAVLAHLGAEVWTIEIVAPLAAEAAERFRALGLKTIHGSIGDGFAGVPGAAPYDGVIVTAGAAEIPAALLDQLKVGGRLIMPVGPSWAQEQLVLVAKLADGTYSRCSLGATMFVALTGRGARPERSVGLYDRSLPPCDKAG